MFDDLEERLAKMKFESNHGVFYPKGYVDAIFEDRESLEKAVKLLSTAGWSSEDIVPLQGDEVLKVHKETVENRSVWDQFIVEARSFMGADYKFMQKNLEHAEAGHYFLLVYAGDDEKAEEIRDIVQTCEPTAMYSYGPLYIVKYNTEA